MRRLFVVISMLLLWSPSALVQDGSRLPLGQLMSLDEVGDSRHMRLAGAYDYFVECPERPRRCESHPEAQVTLDRYRWQELVFVNALVNLQIAAEPEPPGEDVWQDDVSITSGDCEDYALVKRRLLIAKGWPAGALSIAVGRVEKRDRELHGVLIARTDKGDFVLNNQYDEIRLWSETHFYNWLVRQASEDPRKWYEITTPTITVVGSK